MTHHPHLFQQLKINHWPVLTVLILVSSSKRSTDFWREIENRLLIVQSGNSSLLLALHETIPRVRDYRWRVQSHSTSDFILSVLQQEINSEKPFTLPLIDGWGQDQIFHHFPDHQELCLGFYTLLRPPKKMKMAALLQASSADSFYQTLHQSIGWSSI